MLIDRNNMHNVQKKFQNFDKNEITTRVAANKYSAVENKNVWV